MILHFASTGQEFHYTNYLAVLTAKRVHSIDEVKIWATDVPLENQWFDEVSKTADIVTTEVPPLPGYDHFPHYWQKSLKADYLRWAVLEKYGGLYLDLDTVSVKDLMDLLGDKEVCVAPETPNDLSWMGAHCVLAKPKSEVISYTFNFMMKQLNNHHHRVRWGMTAPGALAAAYREFGSRKIRVLDCEVTSPFSVGGMADIFREDAVLPKQARIIHTWSSVHSHVLNNIDFKWIKKSNTPYAIAVKGVLKEEEWNIK